MVRSLSGQVGVNEVTEVIIAIDITIIVENTVTRIDIIGNIIDIEMVVMTHPDYQMKTDLCLLDCLPQTILNI